MTETMHIINAFAVRMPNAVAYRMELSPFLKRIWADFSAGFSDDADIGTVFRGGPDWSEAIA